MYASHLYLPLNNYLVLNTTTNLTLLFYIYINSSFLFFKIIYKYKLYVNKFKI